MKKGKILSLAFSILLFSCSETVSSIDPSSSSPTEVPAIFKKIYGAQSITLEGDYVVIKSNGMPDHKSIYYATNNALYETFSGKTFGDNSFKKNPNSISSQSLTFKIPVNPKKASAASATPLGPIGVSLNGVPFYNQYAGPNQPLTNEITSFDQYYGHPQQSGQYHYHVEPIYLTNVKANKIKSFGLSFRWFPCLWTRRKWKGRF